MASAGTELDRDSLVAHRMRVQQLTADTALTDLAVLDLGIQDTPSGSAALAIAARTGDPRAGEDEGLVRVLSLRGAPHVHRRADLPALRACLRPRAPLDVLAWLGGHGAAFAESGVDLLAVVGTVTALLREHVAAEGSTKGELSGAISGALPEPARPWCETCGAHHVIEGLFRLGTLLAGLELDRGDRRLVFRATGSAAVSADEPEPDDRLLRRFVELTGPVTPNDVLGWLDSRAAPATPPWHPPGWQRLREDLAPVRVEGGSLLVSRGAVAAVADAERASGVVLLPPRDPYLVGHRAFLVPDRALAKRVWRAVGSPGTVVVAGEVVTTWRQRISGRTITLSVDGFDALPGATRTAIRERAELVAAVRGANALEAHVVQG